MKTTNLETSKKLKELGFKVKSDFFFAVDEKYKPVPYEVLYKNSFEPHEIKRLVPAYDLETILEALPKNFTYELIKQDHQQYFRCESDTTRFDVKFIINKEKNESLADAAGRLLVKLLQDNIIKLGE